VDIRRAGDRRPRLYGNRPVRAALRAFDVMGRVPRMLRPKARLRASSTRYGAALRGVVRC
jgi:hypothetical protein